MTWLARLETCIAGPKHQDTSGHVMAVFFVSVSKVQRLIQAACAAATAAAVQIWLFVETL